MPPRRNNQLPAPVEPPLPQDGPENETLPAITPDMSLPQIDLALGRMATVEDLVEAGIPQQVAQDMIDSEVTGGAPAGVVNDLPADPEVRRAEPVLKPTGAFMDLGFIEQINNAPTDEEAKAMYDALDPALKRVYDRSYGMNISPEWAAGVAQEFYKENNPAQQAEVATKQMALSEKQMKLQEDYRQEMTYQRLVGIMNNPKTPSAQWNAARIQLEGLSASIGQRMIPTGQSATAMGQKKNAVGYIGAFESKNPLQNFGPRFDMMQRESQDRMGLLRQQMEAAGVPVPEMAAEQEEKQAAPDWVQITMQKNAVRTPDGEMMTIQPPGGGQPQPIVKGWNQGKQEYRSVGPDGMFYLLTPQQLQQLGLE